MMPKHTFPEGFLWGASGSAFQMEGAIHEDGKSWDAPTYRFFHLGENPPPTYDTRRSPEVGCDYYHRFAQDHDLFR